MSKSFCRENEVASGKTLPNQETNNFTILISDENSSNGKTDTYSSNPNSNLQEVAEKLIDKSDLSEKEVTNNLLKGLCYHWLKNNYSCPIMHCKYLHDARESIKRKLKRMPSNFIIEIVVAMRNDKFFVDVLMEGFNVLKKRPKSEALLPFFCFFAFYVWDGKDEQFFEFWNNAAGYFCSIVSSKDIKDGFAYLLKIFRLIDSSRQAKIIDFITMLKHPYFNFEVNWTLIKPVIAFNIPSPLLIEAVKSCNKTNADADEIYKEVVSRIDVNSLSVDEVEILLRFCEILKSTEQPEKAEALKRRLYHKIQTLEKLFCKNSYPLTHSCYSELKPIVALFSDERNEILKKDEEKIRNRAFSPPPPNCYLNAGFLISHSSLPSKFEGRFRPASTYLRRTRRKYTPSQFCLPYERLIGEIIGQIKNYEFTPAGINLNYFESLRLEAAAETIVQVLLQRKISPEELLDFIEKASYACKSKNSAEIIASIADTMLYFFVNINNDWETAYAIFNLCRDKEIDLSLGKVLASSDTRTFSRLKIVLLLIEVCLHNNKLEDAFCFIEKFKLFSDKHLLKPCFSRDDLIRIDIVKNFLGEIRRNSSYLLDEVKDWEAQEELSKHI